MDTKRADYHTIDEYIALFPADVRTRLAAVRATIRAAAPDAQERISYKMPTFALNGNLVHFAAQKGYIGFYPTSSGVAAFKDELASYKSTPGAIHFPLDQPLPLDLIRRITEFRVAENLRRAGRARPSMAGARAGRHECPSSSPLPRSGGGAGGGGRAPRKSPRVASGPPL